MFFFFFFELENFLKQFLRLDLHYFFIFVYKLLLSSGLDSDYMQNAKTSWLFQNRYFHFLCVIKSEHM